MTTKQVRVYAPASIANLGPGFDVFGLALDGIGDIVSLRRIREPKISIRVLGEGHDKIPTEPQSNSAGAVLQHLVDSRGLDHGFEVEIRKGVPPGKGMGSSGASASAAAVAADRLLGLELDQNQLIELAARGEGAVSGAPHPDNVSASILGGFVVVNEEWEFVRFEPPRVGLVVAVPEIYIENKTMVARSLIPEKVPLRSAVRNIGYAAMMVAGVAQGDPRLFGRCIVDNLVEPHRASMIPHFWDVKEAALEAGAYGCTIAGGGPSLFAVGENIYQIGESMKQAFKDIECQLFYTHPSSRGARVI